MTRPVSGGTSSEKTREAKVKAEDKTRKNTAFQLLWLNLNLDLLP
jgi:hypothetical protein